MYRDHRKWKLELLISEQANAAIEETRKSWKTAKRRAKTA
jgi:hypothetical protein